MGVEESPLGQLMLLLSTPVIRKSPSLTDRRVVLSCLPPSVCLYLHQSLRQYTAAGLYVGHDVTLLELSAHVYLCTTKIEPLLYLM